MKQLIAFAVLALNIVLAAQDTTAPTKQQKATTEQLLLGINQGKVETILEAGNSGDQSLVPALRQQLKNWKGGIAPYARLALAKLGDREGMQELFCLIEKGGYTSLGPRLRKDLPYVGAGTPFKYLMEF